MAIRMQQRRGTSEQWTLANPILSEGEVGFETDNNQFKVGDGVSHWDDLAYFINADGLGGTLGDYILLAEKGEADGVATLDAQGQVPAEQLGNATVDLSDYATEEYVDSAVTNLISSAPEALDTLNELAAALGDDENFATTVTNLIDGKADAEHTHGIDDITTFAVTSPANGQTLVYNSSTQKWENVAASSGESFSPLLLIGV
jgi:hypothetical protein